jgi:hypothetical protein
MASRLMFPLPPIMYTPIETRIAMPCTINKEHEIQVGETYYRFDIDCIHHRACGACFAILKGAIDATV